MKNFVTYDEFLPEIKSTKTLVVTSEYNRVDTETPFLNKMVIDRLVREGKVEAEKIGSQRFKVSIRK